MFRQEAEAASDKARRTLQAQRLHDLVHRLAGSTNSFWRDRLTAIDPREVRELDALSRLPFISPAEVAVTNPWHLLTVPREMTVHADLTPDGDTVVAYTSGDVRVFTEVGARALVAAGGRADDVICVVDPPSRMGLERGGELLGATVVTPPSVDALMTVFDRIGAHGLVCQATASARMAEAVHGHDVPLRYVVCDAILDATRRAELEQAWTEGVGHPVDVRAVLGFAGTIGPVVAASCEPSPDDLHVFDDHFLVEIVDPDSAKRVADGRVGELVVTTLTMEAMPLLRYRTGMPASVVRGACPCERTHTRIRLETVDPDA